MISYSSNSCYTKAKSNYSYIYSAFKSVNNNKSICHDVIFNGQHKEYDHKQQCTKASTNFSRVQVTSFFTTEIVRVQLVFGLLN